jgi:hypothetical protein
LYLHPHQTLPSPIHIETRIPTAISTAMALVFSGIAGLEAACAADDEMMAEVHWIDVIS